MQQSLLEANSLSASQEISHLLRNPKVQFHVHNASAGPYPEPDESNSSHPTPISL